MLSFDDGVRPRATEPGTRLPFSEKALQWSLLPPAIRVWRSCGWDRTLQLQMLLSSNGKPVHRARVGLSPSPEQAVLPPPPPQSRWHYTPLGHPEEAPQQSGRPRVKEPLASNLLPRRHVVYVVWLERRGRRAGEARVDEEVALVDGSILSGVFNVLVIHATWGGVGSGVDFGEAGQVRKWIGSCRDWGWGELSREEAGELGFDEFEAVVGGEVVGGGASVPFLA